MVCELSPSGVVIDTATAPDAISWTEGGEVTFDFGDQDATGLQRAELVAFDPAHPVGQVLAHPSAGIECQLSFLFID